MPGDEKDKWAYSDVEKLIESNLKVGFDKFQNSLSILLPVSFEMGVTVPNNEVKNYEKNKLRINPENDGKYLPLYRGYAQISIVLNFKHQDKIQIELSFKDLNLSSPNSVHESKALLTLL